MLIRYAAQGDGTVFAKVNGSIPMLLHYEATGGDEFRVLILELALTEGENTITFSGPSNSLELDCAQIEG